MRGSASSEMQQTELDRALSRIEDERFLRQTFMSSGYAAVADILADTEEVRMLLANKDSALPLMRARYRELEASMPDTARLSYFVVFGLARDRQMVGDIAAYLKRVMVLPIDKLTTPWLGFLHGVHALELITNGQVRSPGTGGTRKQFEELIAGAQAWAKTHDQ